MKTTVSSTAPAGEDTREWCRQAAIGYSTFFTIPENLRPQSVTIGRRRIITEPASAWLQRVAALGGVKTTRPGA